MFIVCIIRVQPKQRGFSIVVSLPNVLHYNSDHEESRGLQDATKWALELSLVRLTQHATNLKRIQIH